MSEEELKELEKIKNPLCGQAAEFIRDIINSPYLNGYLAVLTTINNLNNELREGVARIVSEMESPEEGVDKADKAFERSHKYITEMKPYYEQLDYFRLKLTPQELEKAEEEGGTLLDTARLRLKQKNGQV